MYTVWLGSRNIHVIKHKYLYGMCMLKRMWNEHIHIWCSSVVFVITGLIVIYIANMLLPVGISSSTRAGFLHNKTKLYNFLAFMKDYRIHYQSPISNEYVNIFVYTDIAW